LFYNRRNPIAGGIDLRFEWDEKQVSEEQRMEIDEFLQRVNELGIENAFYDQEALVFVDGTHVPIPETVKVILD
jgi:hypothetical protein